MIQNISPAKNANILFIQSTNDGPEIYRGVLSKQESFSVSIVQNTDAISAIENQEFEIIILCFEDSLSFTKLCREIRQITKKSTIVYSASRLEEEQMLSLFRSGVEDCITGDCADELLSAKLTALLRRLPKSNQLRTELGIIELDSHEKRVKRDGKSLKLSDCEFRILTQLVHSPNKVLSSVQLSSRQEESKSSDAVRQTIKVLRRKLSWIGAEKIIQTIPNAGYVVRTSA